MTLQIATFRDLCDAIEQLKRVGAEPNAPLELRVRAYFSVGPDETIEMPPSRIELERGTRQTIVLG